MPWFQGQWIDLGNTPAPTPQFNVPIRFGQVDPQGGYDPRVGQVVDRLAPGSAANPYLIGQPLRDPGSGKPAGNVIRTNGEFDIGTPVAPILSLGQPLGNPGAGKPTINRWHPWWEELKPNPTAKPDTRSKPIVDTTTQPVAPVITKPRMPNTQPTQQWDDPGTPANPANPARRPPAPQSTQQYRRDEFRFK